MFLLRKLKMCVKYLLTFRILGQSSFGTELCQNMFFCILFFEHLRPPISQNSLEKFTPNTQFKILKKFNLMSFFQFLDYSESPSQSNRKLHCSTKGNFKNLDLIG